MSEQKPYPFLLEPFTFDGWHGEELLNADIDFAESRARLADEMAAMYEKEGKVVFAEEQREEALYWRGVEFLPADQARAEEVRLSVSGTKTVDALLARAKHSERATQELHLLAERILSGLNALSAHGNEHAARWLVFSLFGGVDKFNLLAHHKPDVFRLVLRGASGLPGIISASSEKTQSNQRLFEQLEVAKDNPISSYSDDAKSPKLRTPANSWALRLINYLRDAQIILRTTPPVALEKSQTFPPWSSAAVLLHPFSGKTWQAWFAVGWEVIMHATDGAPERQPILFEIGKAAASKRPKHCARIGERTKQSNVRAAISTRLKKAFRDLARESSSLRNVSN